MAEPEIMMSESEKIPFETGVSNLLDKMNGIPQRTKEVFLWELVCNSASALHTLGRRTMYRKDLIGDLIGDKGFSIVISPDKGKKTLSIVDNGIGMELDDLKKIHLNVPEHTLKRYNVTVDRVLKKEKVVDFYWRKVDASLGFFAAYMVADKVEITTKHYVGGSGSQCRMSSSASERWCSFTEEDRAAAPVSFPRGTRVTLHLNKDCFEYLEETRLKVLIDKITFYSCPYPISIHVEHPRVRNRNITVLRRSADLKESKKDLRLLKIKFESLRRLFKNHPGYHGVNVVVSDRIYDIPSFLSLDGSTLEINPRNRVMEELRLAAEKDPKDEETLAKIYSHFLTGKARIRLHTRNYVQPSKSRSHTIPASITDLLL